MRGKRFLSRGKQLIVVSQYQQLFHLVFFSDMLAHHPLTFPIVIPLAAGLGFGKGSSFERVGEESVWHAKF